VGSIGHPPIEPRSGERTEQPHSKRYRGSYEILVDEELDLLLFNAFFSMMLDPPGVLMRARA
jgi:hypothetical protein